MQHKDSNTYLDANKSCVQLDIGEARIDCKMLNHIQSTRLTHSVYLQDIDCILCHRSFNGVCLDNDLDLGLSNQFDNRLSNSSFDGNL
jgi:hypothetical protein